ncbi:MAG: hypothetical protein ABI623_06715 [bacterium]
MHDLLGLPIDASTHGHSIDQIIVITHWLMLALFLGWGTFFVYSLIRFRKKRNPHADYVGVKSHKSSYIEVAVALFEGFLLIGFAIPVWSGVWTNYPDPKDAVVVHVVAEQFAWNIHYPGPDGKFGRRDISLVTSENPLGLDRNDPDAKDDIATINQFHVPIGKKILVYLTSKDVIHSFGIPLLRVKQDAIPGQSIPVTFEATKTIGDIRRLSTSTTVLTPTEIKLKHVFGRTAAMDYSNKTGEAIVKRGDAIVDTSIINQLDRSGVSNVLVLPIVTNRVAMQDYSDKSGGSILAQGDALTDATAFMLLDAGIQEIKTAPDTPAEIACAQLCGLGHYRMRATVVLESPADFDKWLTEEAAYLTQ